MRRMINFFFVVILAMAFLPVFVFAEDTQPVEQESQVIQNEPQMEEKKEEKKDEKKPEDFRVYWKEGIRFDSNDKQFSLKIGGRLMNDVAFLSGDESLEEQTKKLENGTEIRRARLEMEGTIYEKVVFKLQFDFAGGEAEMKDGYIGLKKIPVFGNIRAGHFNEPFCLDELTSSKYSTFIERASLNAFAPGRNTGIMIHGNAENERATWALGIFRDVDNFGLDSNKSNDLSARVTFLPQYSDKGKNLFHLGFALSRKDIKSSATAQFRQRPEVHLSPYFIDTGKIAADSAMAVGLEAAMVQGPFSVQGEWIRQGVGTNDGDDPTFTGYYLQTSYFLTGEHRGYKTTDGVFDKVKPANNFKAEEGKNGAWELALRYSNLDLESGSIMGGQMKNLTLGLNWCLNSNSKVMLNYVKSKVADVGDASAIMTRFQVDF